MKTWLKYRLFRFRNAAKQIALPRNVFLFCILFALAATFFGMRIIAMSLIILSFICWAWLDYSRGEWKHWEREELKKRAIALQTNNTAQTNNNSGNSNAVQKQNS